MTAFIDQVTATGAGDVNVVQWNGTAVSPLQTFPANFSAFAVDANGRVDISKVNGDDVADRGRQGQQRQPGHRGKRDDGRAQRAV